jgi:hypothetical protein
VSAGKKSVFLSSYGVTLEMAMLITGTCKMGVVFGGLHALVDHFQPTGSAVFFKTMSLGVGYSSWA